MKLIKIKDIFIVIILLLLLGFLFHEKYQNDKKISEYLEQQKRLVQRFDNLKILSKLQHYGEGKNIEDMHIYTVNKDSILVSTLIEEGYKFIFYFSEFSCSSCYLPFLKKLDKIDKKFKDRTIILAGFKDKKNFNIFQKEHKTGIPMYRIETNLNLYPEYNDYALAFLISENLVIDNLLIIDYNNKDYVDNYLKIIDSKI